MGSLLVEVVDDQLGLDLPADDGETGAILTRRSQLRVDGQTVSGQYLGDARGSSHGIEEQYLAHLDRPQRACGKRLASSIAAARPVARTRL
jgi:hypothetical protein